MSKAKAQFLLFIALIITVFMIVDRLDVFSEENIVLWQEWIRSLGLWAPLAFLGLYTVGAIFFLPGTIFTLIGGAAFGLFLGSMLSIIGATIGAVGAHYTARRFGRNFINQTATVRFSAIYHYKAKLEQNGFLTVLMLRLTPLIPYNGLNLALAYSPIKLKDYALGTVIGITPGAIAYVYLGKTVATLSPQNIAVGIAGIITYMILTAALVKRINKATGVKPTDYTPAAQKDTKVIEGEIIDN